MNQSITRITTCCLALLVAGAAVAQEGKLPRLGYKAPDFTLNTIDGKPITLSNLTKDQSVVLVVLRGYPGYQCPICSAQVGGLRKHAQELADAKALVVFVYPGAADKLADHATEFLKGEALPANFFLVTDPDYKMVSDYGVRWDAPKETAYPSTFVVDRQRTVRYVKSAKDHFDRAKVEDVLKAVPGRKG